MRIYPLPSVHSSLISQNAVHRDVRQFLDEEAALSEEGDSVSSDECDGEELNKSLEGFVVDNTQFSQGLNGKEFMILSDDVIFKNLLIFHSFYVVYLHAVLAQVLL